MYFFRKINFIGNFSAPSKIEYKVQRVLIYLLPAHTPLLSASPAGVVHLFQSLTHHYHPNPGAPPAAPKTPKDRAPSGLRRPSRTNTSHKFYFASALEVLFGSRSTPARLAPLPALPRQRYESVPGKGYFGTLRN